MKFKFAKVTNSRLMGSMGLIIMWTDKDEDIYQYFLLDAEGLGIADYVSLANPSIEDAYKEEERLMGGLGAQRVEVSEEEALFLVKYYGNKNKVYNKDLPGLVTEYIDIVENFTTNINIYNLYHKICKKIENDTEFVNYMSMRFIGWDKESLKYFSNSEEISNMHITSINGTLLKNKVTKTGENKYISQAIYEDEDGYYTCKIAFKIAKENLEYKIKSMLVADIEGMYDFEVFDEISKPEYVSIYSLSEGEKFSEDFYKKNPFLLKSDMQGAEFFTRFNFDNNHVKDNTYIINNDIKATYYVIDDKLFVGTYSDKDRRYINKLLTCNFNKYIQLIDEIYFEENVLYDFVESGSDNFYDFIE